MGMFMLQAKPGKNQLHQNKNKMNSNAKIALIGVSAVITGLIGFSIYRKKQLQKTENFIAETKIIEKEEKVKSIIDNALNPFLYLNIKKN